MASPVDFTPEEYDAAKAALGVRVIDDLTLQLDLTNPAPYFHTVGALWVFFPVKQEIAREDPDNWWKTRRESHWQWTVHRHRHRRRPGVDLRRQ